MVQTVEDGFEHLLARLAPLAMEGRMAQRHRRSIGACLRARFDGARLIPTGSRGRGTALRQYSDADYFIVIPRGLITNDSAEMLKRVRTALRCRFPKSAISVSKPAVIVPFGPKGRESLDVVPAVFAAKKADGPYVFDIPDGSGGWIRSSPGAHKAYVRAMDESHEHRVKQLIMLMKTWKVQCKVPVRSFYLEMRVARYASTVKRIDYARGIERVLENMISPNGLVALRDPTDARAVIMPCMTRQQEQQALKKANRALVRAAAARKSAASGNMRKAVERWDQFFNHTFSAYK